MNKHLTHAQRRESILDAALEILEEAGIESITMSMLSIRTGVSRQIVYLHFRNVEDVLEALFERIHKEYFWPFERTDDFFEYEEERALMRLEGLLDLPPAIERLLASAFFAGPHCRPLFRVIQRRLDDLLEHTWIGPLVNIGYTRAAAMSGVYTIVASTFECYKLIGRNMMTKLDAQIQLGRMIEMLLDSPKIPLVQGAD